MPQGYSNRKDRSIIYANLNNFIFDRRSDRRLKLFRLVLNHSSALNRRATITMRARAMEVRKCKLYGNSLGSHGSNWKYNPQRYRPQPSKRLIPGLTFFTEALHLTRCSKFCQRALLSLGCTTATRFAFVREGTGSASPRVQQAMIQAGCTDGAHVTVLSDGDAGLRAIQRREERLRRSRSTSWIGFTWRCVFNT